MREIKFRAYSKWFDIMFDYDMLKMATAGMVDICNKELKGIVPETKIQMGLFLPTEDEDLVFMQYTGLKDKNGKEIYEGDIVRHFKREEDKLLKVEISPSCGVYAQVDYCTKKILGRNNTHLYYEVIGNIYENPGLLEGGNY